MLLKLRVATWSGKVRKSGKTKKSYKSQVKMVVFEKIIGKKNLKNIRFFQFKLKKFLTFKSLDW